MARTSSFILASGPLPVIISVFHSAPPKGLLILIKKGRTSIWITTSTYSEQAGTPAGAVLRKSIHAYVIGVEWCVRNTKIDAGKIYKQANAGVHTAAVAHGHMVAYPVLYVRALGYTALTDSSGILSQPL